MNAWIASDPALRRKRRKRAESPESVHRARLAEVPVSVEGERQTMRLGERKRFHREVKKLIRRIHKNRRRAYGEMRKQELGLVEAPERKPKQVLTVSEAALVASICKESFFEFVKEFWDTIIPEKPVYNWHIEYLCNEIQQIAERVFAGETKLYDLVVNIPPGTTKSTLISVMLPAWCWTRMPSFRFIGASFTEKLALDLSLKTRDIILSDKYRACFPEIILRDDQNTKSYYKNTRGGYRYAVGVNGSVTGMHAHMIVIDDPIDPTGSKSELDLANSNYWIDSQLSNRKVDKKIAPMILVMQRLHQDDPTALFLRRKKVYHICLPAEAGLNIRPSELVKKYKNGLLDPERMPDDPVLKEERQKGQYYYSSQFMQDPVPAAGGMFKTKRLKVGVPPRQWRKRVRFWDKAGTAGGSGAFTVGTLMGQDLDGRFWILDVQRFREDSFERETKIMQTAERDGIEVMVGTEQEPGSGGKESAEATAKRLQGYVVRIIKVDKTTGGKIERADPFSVQVNAGNVYLPIQMMREEKWVDWAEEWVEEHKFFPHSKYKDQVDSAALAFSLCNQKEIRIGGMDASPGYQE